MRELLVSYLLNELSPEQRERIEQKIQSDPKVRRELERLRACFEGHDPEECEPPEGLADRTLSHVVAAGVSPAWAFGEGTASAAEHAANPPGAVAPPKMSEEFGLVDTASRWRATDLIVAASIVLITGALFSPALYESRAAARKTTCQQNMKRVAQAMVVYSITFDGEFPQIYPGQNAGYFTVLLTDGDFLDRDEMLRVIVCPSSTLAQSLANGEIALRVPTAEEVASLEGAELRELRRWMAGDLAYRLGYLDRDDQYNLLLNLDQPLQPLLSEAPRVDENGQLRGCNHGNGQNVAFHSLNVKFCKEPVGSGPDDHLFSNNAGELRAGYGPNDSVLAVSWVTPGVPWSRLARPESVQQPLVVPVQGTAGSGNVTVRQGGQ